MNPALLAAINKGDKRSKKDVVKKKAPKRRADQKVLEKPVSAGTV